jgi:O6-methylguanine-DNA--protein-cysteine methyltransferase
MIGALFEAPFGRLTLAEKDGALVRIWFPREIAPAIPLGETPLLKAAKRQLSEYFAGTRRGFQLPLNPSGTPFQQQCWQALRKSRTAKPSLTANWHGESEIQKRCGLSGRQIIEIPYP